MMSRNPFRFLSSCRESIASRTGQFTGKYPPHGRMITAAFCFLVGATAFGSDAGAAQLTAADQQDLQRIEQHLNAIDSYEAKFINLGKKGAMARGAIYYKRPDQLRFEFLHPRNYIFIADGSAATLYDLENQTKTTANTALTPLAFLLVDKVRLSGPITIESFARDGKLVSVRLIQTDNPDEGAVELTFLTEPMQLKKLKLVHSEGKAAEFGLFEIVYDRDIDPDLFDYVPDFALQTDTR